MTISAGHQRELAGLTRLRHELHGNNPGYDFDEIALPFAVTYWVKLVLSELGR